MKWLFQTTWGPLILLALASIVGLTLRAAFGDHVMNVVAVIAFVAICWIAWARADDRADQIQAELDSLQSRVDQLELESRIRSGQA